MAAATTTARSLRVLFPRSGLPTRFRGSNALEAADNRGFEAGFVPDPHDHPMTKIITEAGVFLISLPVRTDASRYYRRPVRLLSTNGLGVRSAFRSPLRQAQDRLCSPCSAYRMVRKTAPSRLQISTEDVDRFIE